MLGKLAIYVLVIKIRKLLIFVYFISFNDQVEFTPYLDNKLYLTCDQYKKKALSSFHNSFL